MADVKLKPCPFCGKPPVIDYYAGTNRSKSPCTISCNECGVDMTKMGSAAVVRRWNTRKEARRG